MSDKSPRSVKPSERNRLKKAVARLIKEVGAKRAAHLISRSVSQLRRYGSATASDQISAADVLVLERAASNLIVTGFLAHEHGAALLKLPREATHRSLHAGYTRSAKHMALLFGAYPESPAQAGAALKECDDALSALSDLRAILARLG